jgi:hypothetical protein
LFENSTEDDMRFGFTPEYVRVAVPAAAVAGNEMAPVELRTIHAAGHISGALISPVQTA